MPQRVQLGLDGPLTDFKLAIIAHGGTHDDEYRVYNHHDYDDVDEALKKPDILSLHCFDKNGADVKGADDLA